MMTDGWDHPDDDAKIYTLPLKAMPARLPDPDTIPPREWLYGTRLIRRFVTVMVAPGGTGKSIYALGCAMALASGKEILGERVHHSVPAWVLNLEDPMEEQERRVAAMMIRHGLTREDLNGRLFLHSGRDRRLTIAQPSPDGYDIVYPDKDAVIAAAKEWGIGHIAVDPFVKSHGLEENSNSHMDAAATAWAEIGDACRCSIELVHHVRKGATVDIDAARGGKALTDAARVGQIMVAMLPEEAEKLGISEADRWRHIRLEDAKVNLSPRGTAARWFRLEMVELGNGTPDYPHGDKVAALAPWEPPNVLGGSSPSALNQCLDAIAAGPEPGTLFVASRRGGGVRWVGVPIMETLQLNEHQAKPIIASWLDSGLLFEHTYRHPEFRRMTVGLRVDNSKRPSE